MEFLVGMAVLQIVLAGAGLALGGWIWRRLRQAEAHDKHWDTAAPAQSGEKRAEDRIQEGIANLLSYQAGGCREEER